VPTTSCGRASTSTRSSTVTTPPSASSLPPAPGCWCSRRARFALYNELVRWSADRHGATIVDFWRMREFRDWRYWDHDRMHLGSAGHARMAQHVLDVLGVPHGAGQLDGQPELPPEVVLDRAGRLRANAEWTRAHFVPWVRRRLTGRSSGDAVQPKRPGLAPWE
jgi:hypothetical protein